MDGTDSAPPEHTDTPTAQDQDEGDGDGERVDAAEAAAFAVWQRHRRAAEQPVTVELFRRAYLGIYSTIEAYADELVDDYRLDTRLDAAITAPFRAHVDIDIRGFAQALVADGSLYALRAEPVGVWVFQADH